MEINLFPKYHNLLHKINSVYKNNWPKNHSHISFDFCPVPTTDTFQWATYAECELNSQH